MSGGVVDRANAGFEEDLREDDWPERYERLKRALVACVAVAKAWHGPDVWDIYYNHSPEMKLIREILGPAFACETCHDSGEVQAMTSHLGPEDYTVTVACPDCSFPKDQGHGVPSA